MSRFRYAPLPQEVLCDPELSWTMKGRYGLLLGVAYNKETLDYSLDQIAALWSEAEGQAIDIDSVSAYLGQMSQAGLIRRERKNNYRWETKLLKRYVSGRQTQTDSHRQTATDRQIQTDTDSQIQAATDSQSREQLTPMSSRGQNLTPSPGSGSLLNNNDVDDVVSRLDHQQQQLFYYLVKRGIFRSTALDFASMRIPLAEAVGWGEYAWSQRHHLKNYAGLIVSKLGVRDPAPDYELWTCPLCGQMCQRCECGFMDALEEDG